MQVLTDRIIENIAVDDCEMKPNFRSVNRWNSLINVLSGSFLPVTSEGTKMTVILKLYVAMTWAAQLTYVGGSIAGAFCVPKENALADSTVNFVVTLDIFIMLPVLYSNKDSLKRMIGTMNKIFAANDPMLMTIITELLAAPMRFQQIYTISITVSIFVFMWLPLIAILYRDQFYATDYQIPMTLAKEPFSIANFVVGAAVQATAGTVTFMRKATLDVYTIHWILLMTAQYKYMKLKFILILEKDSTFMAKDTVAQEVRSLTRHHKTVVEMAVQLKRIFSPNVTVLYLSNVFRISFISIMIIMRTDVVETCFLIPYACGALIQLYMICSSIQHLLDESTTMMDSVFHQKWYDHDISLQRSVMLMIMATKLKCEISRIQNVNLTLPSFMSILNKAYSVSLLFLKSRRD